ncbi:hypothetical protein CCACVL1_12362 [Corchorus capsularis]|uniref:Uncharacterized protein n=1 Tax=Corchorus capsularis TaxID=210143 RepID=A0A1R3IG45_COCAP|nr:hypothetical protein CCACVL1_12362 [Corchorus capsularis]
MEAHFSHDFLFSQVPPSCLVCWAHLG